MVDRRHGDARRHGIAGAVHEVIGQRTEARRRRALPAQRRRSIVRPVPPAARTRAARLNFRSPGPVARRAAPWPRPGATWRLADAGVRSRPVLVTNGNGLRPDQRQLDLVVVDRRCADELAGRQRGVDGQPVAGVDRVSPAGTSSPAGFCAGPHTPLGNAAAGRAASRTAREVEQLAVDGVNTIVSAVCRVAEYIGATPRPGAPTRSALWRAGCRRRAPRLDRRRGDEGQRELGDHPERVVEAAVR